MATGALFVSWSDIKLGREAKALEVFQYAVELWGKKQAEKKIESFEPVLFDGQAAGLIGYFLIRGEPAALETIRTSQDFEELVARCMHVVHGLTVTRGRINEGVKQFLQTWQKTIPSK
jgi:hypothetical protein